MPYAENRGARIYWEKYGDGSDVLLIQGLGYTSDMWHRTIPVLARRHRVIAFDNRGVGRSDVPRGPYPIELMASDAAAVLDAARADRAHLFGISMGGYIAQELALQAPDRLRSLILGCTGCGGPNAVLAEQEVLDLLVTRASMPVEQGIRVMIPYIYDPSTPRARVEEDLEVRMRTYPSEASYLGQLQGIMGWESCRRLGSIRLPVLVIHGTSDRLVPPANGRRLAEEIPGARLLMLPNASHVFFTDQPQAAHEAVLSFVAEVEQSGEPRQRVAN